MSTAGGRRDDAITDFACRRIDVDGVTKTVYTAGSGPAVVVMPEMPGISPDVLRLARWVRDAGFTVYVPSLFGIDGSKLGRRLSVAPASAPSSVRSPAAAPAR